VELDEEAAHLKGAPEGFLEVLGRELLDKQREDLLNVGLNDQVGVMLEKLEVKHSLLHVLSRHDEPSHRPQRQREETLAVLGYREGQPKEFAAHGRTV